MRKRLKTVAALIVCGLLAQPARADTFLPPLQTAYDADIVLDYGSSQVNSTVNADHQKERRVIDLAKGQQTVLIRHDLGKAYLIVPGLNVAMAMGNTALPGGLDLDMLQKIPVTAEGLDTIAGLRATRYRVTGQTRQGSFDGKVWATADGILLQVDGQATANGKNTPLKIVAGNVHIRKQDPALFELPAGIKEVPFSFMSLLKGVKAPAQQ